MEPQLNYGNWIRVRILIILGACALGLLLLAVLPLGFIYRLVMMILFVITLISFMIPLYSYVMFSQRGGKLQEKVYNLIIQSLGVGVDGAVVRGRVIDIGSGNGVLAVKVALQHTAAEVVGVDYWGQDWEYSQRVCEENARAAHVEDRVCFQKGDAAALEFPDNTFDGATSNLTFHEVQSVADKRAVVQEALRVVKLGGSFAFVDYFYEPKYYGAASEFESYLKGLKLAEYKFKPLQSMLPLPLLLRHPKVLGRVGILYGIK
jgi:SAM-dependent methyltransferase